MLRWNVSSEFFFGGKALSLFCQMPVKYSELCVGTRCLMSFFWFTLYY